MDVQETRRKRLKMLVEEYGTQTALAERIGIEQNYISRALGGKKRIKEDFAARVEQATEKPAGWMSLPLNGKTDWPFDFDRRHWDNLPEVERQQLARNFQRLVMGTEAEVTMRRSRKKTG